MKTEIESKIKVLEILNDLAVKYGHRSTIALKPRDHSNPMLFDVVWYDVVGGSFPLKNISYTIPKDWLGMTQEKMERITKRFNVVLKLPFLSDVDVKGEPQKLNWVEYTW